MKGKTHGSPSVVKQAVGSGSEKIQQFIEFYMKVVTFIVAKEVYAKDTIVGLVH